MEQPGGREPSPPKGNISSDAAAEVRSPSGYYAAVTLCGSDGLLRVSVFQWFYDEVVDEEYWGQISTDLITDTLETATKLAHEELEKFRFRADFI